MEKNRHNVLSLFANIGVAEAYLEEIGYDVVVANEILSKRANLYNEIYPKCKMICGDINNKEVFSKIITYSKKAGIDIIMATPPCQGMSTAGEQNINDERNKLLLPVINCIQKLNPKYVLIENVPNFLNTTILYRNKRNLLIDILQRKLKKQYRISINIINTADYGIAQSRERAIILLTRSDLGTQWIIPHKDAKVVTMRDAIGWIDQIDPFIKDLPKEKFLKIFPHYEKRKKKALSISKWNTPPTHIFRQVLAMQYTPTGKSAFDNAPKHRPTKIDGTMVKGYKNTYMRQRWDSPAFTITMDNRKISSQGNVHPGRYIGKDKYGEEVYSDARVLTLYELMKIMSLPDNWALPENIQESFVRRIIGEGIPPLFIKKLFNNIPE